MSRAYAVALAILLLKAATLAHSAWTEPVNCDESEHVYGGFRIWTAGDWSVSPHPPLTKLLAGAPLVLAGAVQVPIEPERPYGAVRTAWPEARQFIHHNALSPAAILRLSRAPTLVLWVVLGLVVVGAARALHGPLGGWIALGLFVTCPQLSTYGRIVTTDLPLALAVMLAVIAAARWGEAPSLRRTITLGAALGMAFASRHASAIPAAALAVTLVWGTRGAPPAAGAWAPQRVPLARTARHAALAVTVALAVLGASYGGVAYGHLLRGADLLSHAYYGDQGHDTYFFAGHTSEVGWWWFFPAVTAVKHAPGHLVVIAVAVASLVWRRPRAAELLFLVPVAVYVVAAAASGINYSIRHLLSLWPLLYVVCGRLGAGGSWRRAAWLALPLAASAVELARVHPYYQGYASSLVGGPAEGPRWVADDSSDSGGGSLGGLDLWSAERGDPPVWLAYFGQGEPSCAAYGIPFRALPVAWDSELRLRETRRDVACPRYLAVSAHYLQLWNRGTYWPLLAYEPVARPGWAMYVYDVARDPELLVWLAVIHVDGASADALGPRTKELLLERAVELLAGLRNAAPLFERTRPAVRRFLGARPDTQRWYGYCLERAGLVREAREQALPDEGKR